MAFLIWLPKIFFFGVFAAAVFLYFSRRKKVISHWSSIVNYQLLIISCVVFRFFYAFLLTASQYYVWSQNKLTQLLLSSPLAQEIPISGIFNKICQLSIVNCQKLGYFLFYSYGRFWLNVLISIGAAFIFYLLLKSLEKYRGRFFEEGETKLGFLAALIVGWPNFAVFLPLVFISVILISIYRRIFLKETYTTLGWPFILAILITLVWGNKLIYLFNFGALKI